MIDHVMHATQMIVQQATIAERAYGPATAGWLIKPLQGPLDRLRAAGVGGRIAAGILGGVVFLLIWAVATAMLLWGVFGSMVVCVTVGRAIGVPGVEGLLYGIVAGLANMVLTTLALGFLLHGLNTGDDVRDVFGSARWGDDLDDIARAGLKIARKRTGR